MRICAKSIAMGLCLCRFLLWILFSQVLEQKMAVRGVSLICTRSAMPCFPFQVLRFYKEKRIRVVIHVVYYQDHLQIFVLQLSNSFQVKKQISSADRRAAAQLSLNVYHLMFCYSSFWILQIYMKQIGAQNTLSQHHCGKIRTAKTPVRHPSKEMYIHISIQK